MSQRKWIDTISQAIEAFDIDPKQVVNFVITGNYAEFTLLVDEKYQIERFYRIEPKE